MVGGAKLEIDDSSPIRYISRKDDVDQTEENPWIAAFRIDTQTNKI